MIPKNQNKKNDVARATFYSRQIKYQKRFATTRYHSRGKAVIYQLHKPLIGCNVLVLRIIPAGLPIVDAQYKHAVSIV